jgi:hypothetical protein
VSVGAREGLCDQRILPCVGTFRQRPGGPLLQHLRQIFDKHPGRPVTVPAVLCNRDDILGIGAELDREIGMDQYLALIAPTVENEGLFESDGDTVDEHAPQVVGELVFRPHSLKRPGEHPLELTISEGLGEPLHPPLRE